VETAAAAGVAVEVRTFPEGTRTAADAAAAIGCPLGAIVKSIVLDSDAGPLVVLTSGVNRVDYGKVATARRRRIAPAAARSCAAAVRSDSRGRRYTRCRADPPAPTEEVQ
jgi:prolyl-tRNA editing enzyme YbaK/EbsC (Cys-tRNA(Pro) deacylase)